MCRLKQTVYIVDDEPMAIHYLKTLLQDTGLDIEVIGDASNGVRAIQEIIKLKPDFVFVDISMPVMDGLEMSEKVLVNNPSQKIFMLTAYRDFEYAKKSVKIGVTDYLLKNELSENLLRQLIQSNTQNLEQEKKQRHIIMEMNVRNFFLWDKSGGGEWIYQDKPLQRYILFYITIRPQIVIKFEEKNEILHVDCFEIENAVSDDKLTCRSFAEIAKGEYVGIFFINDQTGSLENQGRDTAKKIMMYFEVAEQPYLCMISKPVNRFADLQKTYKQLHRKATMLFDQTQNIFFEPLISEKESHIEKESLLKDYLNWQKNFLEENENEAKVYLDRYLAILRKSATVWDYSEKIEEIHHFMCNQIRDYKLDESEFTLNATYSDLNMLETDLLRLQDDYFKTLRNRREHQYSKHVVLAQEFVFKNYERDISVADIAEAVGISEGHLRRCFKQEMNVNVVNFLTEYRLTCAKKMMKTGYQNLDDIWKKCGFASAQYFSYLFKKKEGITPREFANHTCIL